MRTGLTEGDWRRAVGRAGGGNGGGPSGGDEFSSRSPSHHHGWAVTTSPGVRIGTIGGDRGLSTIRSLSLCRSLLRAGLVDRFRVVMFPVITGATGAERIYDGYPDVALEMIDSRTFDGRTQLVEYRPRVLERPPLAPSPSA